MHRGLKLALLHLDPIVVEPHLGDLSRMNIDKAAESDDVVVTGDGSEDTRLDVIRS